MLARYNLGEILHELYGRTRHIEEIFNLTNTGTIADIATQNITIKSKLSLQFCEENTILSVGSGGNVNGKSLSTMIKNVPNQTTVQDIGLGIVQIGLPQDISDTSDVMFNDLRIYETFQIAPKLYDILPTNRFEIMGSTISETSMCLGLSGGTSSGPILLLQKATGTYENPVNVPANYNLGKIQFVGRTGSEWTTVSEIQCMTSDNFSDFGGHSSSVLDFKTTNSSMLFSQMTIGDDGHIELHSQTVSTSPSTGAMLVNGGIGMLGNLHVRGDVILGGVFGYEELHLTDTIDSTSTSTGTVTVDGGVGIGGSLYLGGNEHMYDISDTTSLSTGSIVINGGVGIGKNIFVGHDVTILGRYVYLTGYINDTTDSLISSTGAISLMGGMGVGGDLYANSVSMSSTGDNSVGYATLHITSGADSTSPTSGALIAGGGMGIAKSASVGTSIMLGTTNLDERHIKFPSDYVNPDTGSYLFNTPDSLNLSYNGFFDGANWTNYDDGKIPTQLSCRDGKIIWATGVSTGGTPRNMFECDNVGLFKLYYASHNISDNSIYTTFQTNSQGELIIGPIGKHIVLGSNNVSDYRLKFIQNDISNTQTYGYICGQHGGILSASSNCFWNGSEWNTINPMIRSSNMSISDTKIDFMTSSILGSVPSSKCRLDKNGHIIFYATPELQSELYTTDSGFLTFESPINQINVGENTQDYSRMAIPTNALVNGYLYSSMQSMAMSFGGYRSDNVWVSDDINHKSSELVVSYGSVKCNISVANGASTQTCWSVTNDGRMNFTNTNNQNKISSISTNSFGETIIDTPTGLSTNMDSIIKILSSVQSSNHTTGALLLSSGGGLLSKNNIVGGTANTYYNYDGLNRQCNSASGSLTIRRGFSLWDAGLPYDKYVRFVMSDSVNNSKRLDISGYNSAFNEMQINMPFSSRTLNIKYDDNNKTELFTTNNGELQITSYGTNRTVNFDNGLQVNIQNTTPVTNTSTLTGALQIQGGMIVGKKLVIGNYPTKNTAIQWGTSIQNNMSIWDNSEINSSFIFDLADRQNENIIDGRTLEINSAGASHRSVIFEKSLNVLGHINPITSNNWFIVMFSNMLGAQNIYKDCNVIIETPDGRKSELIMTSSGCTYKEIAFDNTLSGDIVVATQFNTSGYSGNTATPTEFMTVQTSVEQVFTLSNPSGSSYSTSFNLWASAINCPTFVTMTLYAGVGTGGTIKASNRIYIDRNNAMQYSPSPGGINLINGTYTVKLTAPHAFNIGITDSFGAVNLTIDGTVRNNKVSTFYLSYGISALNCVVLIKRNMIGTTYRLMIADQNISSCVIDTGSQILYASTILSRNKSGSATRMYATNDIVKISNMLGPSANSLDISGGMGISGNVMIGSGTITNTINSSSTSTGSLLIGGGMGCSKMISVNVITSQSKSYANDIVRISEAGNWSAFGEIKNDLNGSLILGPTSSNKITIGSDSIFNILNTDDISYSSTTSGSIIVSGGCSVGNSLNIGGTDDSTSATTGSLIINGGCGIIKNMHVGGTVYVNNKSLNDFSNSSELSNMYHDNILTLNSTTTSINIVSICYSPQLGIYVAVGANTNFIQISRDGVTWLSYYGVTTDSMNCVEWIPELSLFIAVGISQSGSRLMTSNDGISWVGRIVENSDWKQIAWSRAQNKLVCVGVSGTNRCMVSNDGLTWIANNGLGTSEWMSVCYSDELDIFVAVSRSANIVGVSSNGTSWVIYSTPALMWSICWSPELSLFVGVGDNTILTSSDGIIWVSHVSPSDYIWVKCIWIPQYRMFYCIGRQWIIVSSTWNNAVMYSFDGRIWTAIILTDVMPAIAWNTVNVGCCYSSILKQITVSSYEKVYYSLPKYEKIVVLQTSGSTNEQTGCLVAFGGCGLMGNMVVGGNVKTNATFPSVNTTTGSVIVAGGIGIAGNVYTNNQVTTGSAECDSVTINTTTISTHLNGSLSGSFTGPVVIPATVMYERIGNMITIFCPVVTGITIASAYFSFSANIISDCRPTNDVFAPCRVQNGASSLMGITHISTGGVIHVWAGPTDAYTFNTGVTASFQFVATYNI